jgi:hypothetical protein
MQEAQRLTTIDTSHPGLRSTLFQSAYHNGFPFRSDEHQALIEERRLVRSAEVEQYSAEILASLRTAYQRQSDAVALPEIRIYICDNHGLAGIQPEHAIIYLDKQLFQVAQDEAEIAWAIAREFSHYIYRWSKLTESRERLSKFIDSKEALWCDYNGQKLAVAAGYSSDGSTKLLKNIHDREKTHSRYDRVFRAIDELHRPELEFHDRLSALERDFVGAERLTTGDASQLDGSRFEKPIVSGVVQAAAALRHTSYLDELKSLCNYEARDISGKIDFIKSAYPLLTNMGRRYEFEELVKDLVKQIDPQLSWATRDEAITEQVLYLGEEAASALFDYVVHTYTAAEGEIWKWHARCVGQELARLCGALLPQRMRPKDGRVIPDVGQARPFYEAKKALEGAKSLRGAHEALEPFLKAAEFAGVVREAFGGEISSRNIFIAFPHLSLQPTALETWKRWMIADTSGTLLRFGYGRLKFDLNKLFDSTTLRWLETRLLPGMKEAAPGESSGSSRDPLIEALQEHVSIRKQAQMYRCFPNAELLQRSPREWCQAYAIFLGSIPYSSDRERYPANHPFKQLSENDLKQRNTEAWRLLSERWKVQGLSGGVVEPWNDLNGIEVEAYYMNSHHPVAQYLADAACTLSSEEKVLVALPFYHSFIRGIDGSRVLGDISLPVPQTKEELIAFSEQLRVAVEGREDTFGSVKGRCRAVIADLYGDLLNKGSWQFSSRAFDPELLTLGTKLWADCGLTGYLETCARIMIDGLSEDEAYTREILKGVAPGELIQLYHSFQRAFLFPSSHIRGLFGDVLVHSIERVADCNERIKLISKMLDRGSFDDRRPYVVLDLSVRSRLVQLLGVAYREYLEGADDGSSNYENRFYWRWSQNYSQDVRAQILAEIAEAVAAQPTLSFSLERLVGEEEPLTSLVKGLTLLIQEVGKDDAKRLPLIDFLTSDGGRAACEKFYNVVDTWRCSRLDEWGMYTAWRFASDRVLNTLITWEINYGGDRCSDTEALTRKADEHQRELGLTTLADLYAQFADLAQEKQALLLRAVLVPTKDQYQRGDVALWDGCSIILNKLFPLDELPAGSEERRDAEWARELFTTLVEVSDPSERNFLLGALAAGARIQEGSAERSSTGRTLRQILPKLGPSFIKLGQAIRASEHTPQAIRDELGDLMGNVDRLVRWKMWRYVASLMKEREDHIPEILELSGAASFNHVYFARNKRTGEREALGFLREYAAPLAAKGFGTMAATAERAACLRPHRAAILDIIRHAEELAKVELDAALGAQQNTLQCEQFRGVQVTARGRTFTFMPRRWKAWGATGWRVMEPVSGPTFRNLPAESDEEQSHRSAAAEAILVAELTNIARGREVDYNRTEANVHVDGSTVYPIDSGGMSLTVPTEQERATLGLLLADLVRGEDLWKAFNARTSGASSDYFQRLKHSFLYLGFAFEAVPRERLAGIFAAVLASGEVDGVVRRAMYEDLGTEASLPLKVLSFRPVYRAWAWWNDIPVFTRMRGGTRHDAS